MTSFRRKLIAGTAALAVAGGTGLAAAMPAQAEVRVGASVLISEVYGGGGNTGAVFTNDFIELFNPGATAVDLTGWSVQYGSATGSTFQKTDLAGSIPAGGYYLVQEAKGTGGTEALPTPDATGTLAMAGAAGKVALVNNTTLLACGSSCAKVGAPDVASLVDFVGWGTANDYAGTVAAPGTSNTQSVSRNATNTNTASNSADFTLTDPPTPQNSSGPVVPPGPVTLTAPAAATVTAGDAWTGQFTGADTDAGTLTYSIVTGPAAATINDATGLVSWTPTESDLGAKTITVKVTNGTHEAQASVVVTVRSATSTTTPISAIQGTGAASPMVGQTVTTAGYVTGRWASNGFTIQTPGTGGAINLATTTGSEAVYVSNSSTNPPAVGTYVEVTGTVAETSNRTQINATVANIAAATPVGVAPTPITGVPWPASDADREKLEGMLYSPAGNYVVTDTYSTNGNGDLGLASGTTPLHNPTDVADPHNAAAIAAVNADNAARAVTLGDGFGSVTYTSAAVRNAGTMPPYISTTNPVRVEAPVNFNKPVIVNQVAAAWKLEPTTQITGNDESAYPATFTNTRTAAPDAAAINKTGTADLKIASFNMLNFFPTTGEDWLAKGGTCTWYTDRDGNRITVNQCSGTGPRGAANAVNYNRQLVKEVEAINGLGADVVGLLEVENAEELLGVSHADDVLQILVTALNAKAGAGTWSFVPTVTGVQTDAITPAIIYRSAKVTLTGPAVAMKSTDAGWSDFSNARKPIAAVFTPVGGGDPFLVSMNHLKSKGSGAAGDGDTGQGASNLARTAQANALAAWIQGKLTNSETIFGVKVESSYILGDLNAYGMEDPIVALESAGYTDLEKHAGSIKHSYSYGGQSGSLDHALANPAGLARLTGSDIWNINSGESIALEYSRYHYTAGDYYAEGPYRSSDHDPVIMGIKANAQVTPATFDLNLVSINDFHGRLTDKLGSSADNWTSIEDAATIEKLLQSNPNSLFISGGDNIGASTFVSASLKDNPTTEFLNAMGLTVSAVGNHEFDNGIDVLNARNGGSSVTNPDYVKGTFPTLGANVYAKGTKNPVLPEYFIKEVNGIKVGFVGLAPEDTPSLVVADKIAAFDFGDPVEAANRVAAQLTDGDPSNGEADVLVLLAHMDAKDPASPIVTQASAKYAAIFTGHSHATYVYDAQVPGAAAGVKRPVIQSASYGTLVGNVTLTIDTTTKTVTGHTAQNVAPVTTKTALQLSQDPTLPLTKAAYDVVAAAKASSDLIGNEIVGKISASITRSSISPSVPAGQGRGIGETSLGLLVAQAMLESTQNTAFPAQIAVVNPGGIRTDLTYTAPGDVTYGQVNTVLPFANNLQTVTMTGADIKSMLEQQWQQELGGSNYDKWLGLAGITYSYDSSQPVGSRIIASSMKVGGQPMSMTATYQVATNNFLSGGGDNFTAFRNNTAVKDTGKIDSVTLLEYFAAHPVVAPPSASQLTATYAPSTSLTLLNINDFHGRIDANTVKFAGTIEQQRALGGDAKTMLLSAGDNIGASLFASAILNDNPTIDVLNALDVKASAVGNHEFDKGWDDLKDRVTAAADFPYLGANVYAKGTTTPVLPEYEIVTIDGVRVAVIGTVTQETPTLVTPSSVAMLDFGDAVEATNRVAAKIKADGLADIIVAEYHDGSPAGTPEGVTIDQEIAASPTFAKIVNETSPLVNVIFTGHTHKQYAWNGQVPGAAAGVTRPIVQTGSYGENIGKVVLNIDKSTMTVNTYTASLVARTTTSDDSLVADYPRVADVKTIVDAALANATTVGGQPVGKISADITRAWAGGTYVDGKYTGGTTDDRGNESAMGTLVGNALRETLKNVGDGVDIGVVNPGGMRDDLRYTGDGTITFADVQKILPFNNNLTIVTLKGSQIVTMLEQQWQRTQAGTVPSRSFLQLGLSDNVAYTYDTIDDPNNAGAKLGKVSSVMINGVALDPNADYRVGTFSFLAAGGDNFWVFQDGTALDTGLLDWEGWVQYVKDHSTGGAVLSPDFTRRGVQVSGLDTTPNEGDTLAFTVGKLNITSLGAPESTALEVKLGGTTIGTATIANGVATISAALPAGVSGAQNLTLTASPSGTLVTIPLTITPAEVPPTPEVTLSSGTVAAGGSLTVTVSGVTPDTAIEVTLDGEVIGTLTSDAQGAGSVTVTIPAGTTPGAHTIALTGSGVDLSAALTVTAVDVPTPQITLSTNSAVAGDKLTVSVTGATPNTAIQVWLHSDPVLLGTLTSDAQGAGSIEVTIPTNTVAGAHTIMATGDGVELSAPLTVTAAVVDPDPTDPPTTTTPATPGSTFTPPATGSLAGTGSDSALYVMLSLLVLGAGVVVLRTAQRRKA